MKKLKALVIAALSVMLVACGGPSYSYEPFGDREIVIEIPEQTCVYAEMESYEDGLLTKWVDETDDFMITTYISKLKDSTLLTKENITKSKCGDNYQYNVSLVTNAPFDFYSEDYKNNNEYPDALFESRKNAIQLHNYMKDKGQVKITMYDSEGVELFVVTNDYTYDLIDATY